MRGLTQRLEDALSYRGAWLRPSNFESFWETSVTFAQNAYVESVVELPSATQAQRSSVLHSLQLTRRSCVLASSFQQVCRWQNR